jgi:hypothetical protein
MEGDRRALAEREMLDCVPDLQGIVTNRRRNAATAQDNCL